ncbi:hypothetical protein ACFLS1_07765, partial [Verrucomicrobiota bacterium]
FCVALIILSAGLYLLHYLIFHDSYHIWIYMVGDIAFVPIEVVLVTLVIHRALKLREKRSMLNKLNMVIGAFFSESGTPLLKIVSDFDSDKTLLSERLSVNAEWTEDDFRKALSFIRDNPFQIDNKKDLTELKTFLVSKRSFLLTLLENPNLLEHETFTDMLPLPTIGICSGLLCI